MSTPLTTSHPSDDRFAVWTAYRGVPARQRGRPPRQRPGRLRFAFYGRISTHGYQDPASSRQWQHDNAARLTTGHGSIVAEYFDTGYSRSLPWHQRPAAALLLRDAGQPDRDFDAVVIGEYERAFAGHQALHIIPQLQGLGVQVWLPEAGGPIDLDDPTHRALVMLLGHQSEREVLRARTRTISAMSSQARDQGRHLGGRPPYGYQLIDAGPHPNRDHARWGRRLQRLHPDPTTAPHVRWIFAQRLTGASTASIARTLNERAIPSPAAHDPGRNRHRTATAWTVRTVAAILANPRYTGRQVWNRQRTDHRETVPGDKHTSRGPVRRWNRKADWIISTRQAHAALVSDDDFLAAQRISAACTPHDDAPRRYALTGLLICRHCQRRLQPHWVHGRPAYRCRHGHTSAHRQSAGARWIYWPEHRVLREATEQLIRDGRLPANNDTDQLLAYLRTRNAVIICDAATVTMDDPSKDEPTLFPPAMEPLKPDRPPIPRQRGDWNGTRDSRHLETRRGLQPAANREPHRNHHAKRE